MLLKAFIGIAATGFILAGCATVDNSEPNPDPLDAVQTAYNHNDWRLLALPSTNPDIPGVPGDVVYLKNVELKFGLNYTTGTAPGDVKYAEIYNHKMLELLGCDVQDPMKRCQK